MSTMLHNMYLIKHSKAHSLHSIFSPGEPSRRSKRRRQVTPTLDSDDEGDINGCIVVSSPPHVVEALNRKKAGRRPSSRKLAATRSSPPELLNTRLLRANASISSSIASPSGSKSGSSSSGSQGVIDLPGRRSSKRVQVEVSIPVRKTGGVEKTTSSIAKETTSSRRSKLAKSKSLSAINSVSADLAKRESSVRKQHSYTLLEMCRDADARKDQMESMDMSTLDEVHEHLDNLRQQHLRVIKARISKKD